MFGRIMFMFGRIVFMFGRIMFMFGRIMFMFGRIPTGKIMFKFTLQTEIKYFMYLVIPFILRQEKPKKILTQISEFLYIRDAAKLHSVSVRPARNRKWKNNSYD
jgi:hypothetical protein